MCLERVTCSPPGNRKLMCTKLMNENVAISYMASIKIEYFFYLKNQAGKKFLVQKQLKF